MDCCLAISFCVFRHWCWNWYVYLATFWGCILKTQNWITREHYNSHKCTNYDRELVRRGMLKVVDKKEYTTPEIYPDKPFWVDVLFGLDNAPEPKGDDVA